MYFDPLYFIMLMPALLLGMWAQFQVKSAYAKASRIGAQSRLSGAETAVKILEANGLQNVKIEQTSGHLSDHYDPRGKVLRLSEEVYHGRSLASLGIAAHEVGHAIQDGKGYAPLHIRNGIVPLAAVGSNASFAIILIGAIFSSMSFILLGIGLFSIVVFFQLINLPVEFNASSRAKKILLERGMISPSEQQTVSKVLNAAALTYVAATISAILTLLYYLVRFGVIGGRRD